ncbi:MAG: hypothetical protein GXO89_16550 [Chlorobi bacterium]|nr:hypothetical protein [Chlorobiota bacterium]
MDKPGIRAQLLKICKEIQLKTIGHLGATMEDAQKSANEYGCPRDRYDAYRAQLLRQRDMFAQQLQKAQGQLDILNRIPAGKIFEKVGFGAVVQSDKNNLFISIGLGKIKLTDTESSTTEEYYAISPQVPIYKEMEGKRAGDTFRFNGRVFTIREVF